MPAEQLSSTATASTVRGLRGEYFDNNRLDGHAAPDRAPIARIDFGWTLNSPGRGIPFDWYSVRWTGTLDGAAGRRARASASKATTATASISTARCSIDNWQKQSYGTRSADVTLAPGSRTTCALEYFESTGNARLKLVWDAGVSDDWGAKIAEAAAARRGAATSRSSSPASRKGSSAIARSSVCPGIRRS